MDDLKSILILGSLFLLLFGIAELLHHKLNIGSETTRKMVHVFTGVLALLFPLMFDTWWPVALLCGSFFIILIISQQTKQLASINEINRKSYGSLLYPLSVFLCFLYYQQIPQSLFIDKAFYYCLPVLLLAICDPLAALVGTLYKKSVGRKEGKTLAGSIVFFIAAAIISCLILHSSANKNEYWHVATLTISLTTTIGERLSKNGWDNLVIPLVTITCLFLFSELA